MRRANNEFIFSASDITNYVSCGHLNYLNWQDHFSPQQKNAIDDQTKLILEKGDEHEKKYLDELKQKGIQVINCIEGCTSFADRIEKTKDALSSGAEVLYQACLFDEQFAGYSDFLIKVDRPSKLGNYSYEVLDTKLASKEKAYFILQLSLYSEMLSKIQGVMPDNIHVVLGSWEKKTFVLNRYYAYFTNVKKAFLEEVANFKQGSSPYYPKPCSHCSLCHYSELCKETWENDDHLSLVANIRSSQIDKLTASGIKTVRELAETEKLHIENLNGDIFKRLKAQASLQKMFAADGNHRYELLPPSDNKKVGFYLMPEPNEGDLFYDIEGDPLIKEEARDDASLALKGGLEYLHGVYFKENSEYKFTPFWAFSKGREEKKCFEDLMDFFTEHLSNHKGAHIYHYAPYEVSALKRLMSQYGTREAELDNLLRSGAFVDLYKVVKHSILVSEPKYSIKNLERFYMGKREQELKSGGASVVWFEEFLKTGNKKLINEIEEYNKVDCVSTQRLRDWLLERKIEASKKFNINFSKSEIMSDAEEGENNNLRTESENVSQKYYNALCFDLPEKQEDYTEAHAFKEILYFLVDFYRREAKPAYWEMFSRVEKTTLELMDDEECLAGCERRKDIPAEPIKRSVKIWYRFPPQETKLQVGDSVLDVETRKGHGQITELKSDENMVALKIGAKSETKDYLSLMPTGPISTGKLHGAVLRFIDSCLETILKSGEITVTKEIPYSASIDILFRNSPRVEGIESEEELISVKASEKEFIPQLTDVLLNLKNSYLFIQGPPGTGKTYTASHLLVNLMKQGKRVGVTSNTHKAINNLLIGVERVAEKQGFSFRGAKKSSDSEEQMIKGEFIKDFFDTKELLEQDGLNLIAGTAWLFAEEALNQEIDYLFIDEAGQFSLAHTIAVATSAKNIILLGDPMQLAQPTQGIHPGESGFSALEYLLGDAQTVSKERGVFLETTRRMHASISDLISEQIYDGRLEFASDNNNQKIVHAVSGVPEYGVVLDSVIHQGNSTCSEEEAARINDLLKKFIGATFIDKYQEQKIIALDDILIVAPYNLQVRLISKIVGAGARVGTIDKFQGQEAPITIVSMTTSSGEEVPRGLEFLFSKNRLNVAISRAQALCIIVASPELMRVRCRTPEQIELVNTLCAVDFKVSREQF